MYLTVRKKKLVKNQTEPSERKILKKNQHRV